MFSVKKETIEMLKERYPEDCRVRLLHMDDKQAPPIGTEGTVMFVDDIGTIHVHWDTGSCLGVVLGEDAVCRV